MRQVYTEALPAVYRGCAFLSVVGALHESGVLLLGLVQAETYQLVLNPGADAIVAEGDIGIFVAGSSDTLGLLLQSPPPAITEVPPKPRARAP